MSPTACPECLQGKHGNCDGTSWDAEVDGICGCTCSFLGHKQERTPDTEPIGTAEVGDVPQCNGRCGVQGYGEDAHPDFDRDCPIHGDAADNRPEWCEDCEAGVEIADQFDDQLGFEEQARDVKVTALSCGHDIVRDMKGRTL